MTDEKFAEINELKVRKDKLESFLKDKGNPLTLSMGITGAIQFMPESDMYRYIITGMEEELQRVQMEFDAL